MHMPLQDLSDEVDRLVVSGRWNEQEFRRIRTAAWAITPRDEALEFVYMVAEPAWIARLTAELKAQEK